MSKRTKLRFRVFDTQPPREIVLAGQTSRTLCALVEAGSEGATALSVSSWAIRWSAYIHELRRRHGLLIEMSRVPHNDFGDWHGVHRLVSRVEILGPEPPTADRRGAQPANEMREAA